MCGAIDSTLGAISSGALHSRLGACDPRGLFAKRVLHGDSHYALGITSLKRRVKSALVVSLTTGKDGEIVGHCRQPNRAVSGRRSCRREFLFASILRCPLESACSNLPVKIRSSVAHKLEDREEPYERPYWRDRPGHY